MVECSAKLEGKAADLEEEDGLAEGTVRGPKAREKRDGNRGTESRPKSWARKHECLELYYALGERSPFR